MRIKLFLVCLSAAVVLPAFALELGPAGVPGAPGLVPPPPPVQSAESPELPPAPPPEADLQTPSEIPAACAKAKNVERCVARQEQKRAARAACKGKKGENYRQCVGNYMNRRKKQGNAG
jgi:hypothetical protein